MKSVSSRQSPVETVRLAPACGWYVQISAQGVWTSAGFYDAAPADLARLRSAIADDKVGPTFERMVAGLVDSGFTLGGETLKTAPRGFDVEHPRIELLRHKSLSLGRSHGFEPVIHTPELLDLVRADRQALRPFIEWIAGRIE